MFPLLYSVNFLCLGGKGIFIQSGLSCTAIGNDSLGTERAVACLTLPYFRFWHMVCHTRGKLNSDPPLFYRWRMHE